MNPFVVHFHGESAYTVRHSNFRKIIRNKKKREKLLKPFLNGHLTNEKTEVYFSFDDSKCTQKCRKKCEDKMLKFKLYTGKRNFDQVKKGGEGFVSFGTWHNQPAAFKVVKLGRIEFCEKLHDAISNAQKTRAEFETSLSLSHPNIVKVLHLFRYQESEKMKDIQLFENWTVIVMEKHEKNIRELSPKERNYLPDLLQDVLGLVLHMI